MNPKHVFRGFMPRPHGSIVALVALSAAVAGVFRGFMPRPHGSVVAPAVRRHRQPVFSAALCRGLIEA